ncbi:MAG TPA: hypothetical protein VD905_07005 [Flavobacteriales bacterium]|nr:hypothetical protein [Flavobacteriales bacterium]
MKNLSNLQWMIKGAGILIFLLLFGARTPQPTRVTESTLGAHYKKLLSLLNDSLGFKLGENFYTLVDSNGKVIDFSKASMHYYVYASYANEQKSVFGENAFNYFGHDKTGAVTFADSLKRCGYDVLVYKTAGTSGAKFNKRMLEYNPGTIAFIMLHEGFHRHRQNTRAKLPYVFEEAVCDLTGNIFAANCVKPGTELSTVKKFVSLNEKLYTIINQGINAEISQKKCSRLLKRALRRGDAFQHDRYRYKVNNAYYIRYTAYCKYYFTLKQAFERCKNPKQFYESVMKLEGDEQDVLKAIEKIGK